MLGGGHFSSSCSSLHKGTESNLASGLLSFYAPSTFPGVPACLLVYPSCSYSNTVLRDTTNLLTIFGFLLGGGFFGHVYLPNKATFHMIFVCPLQHDNTFSLCIIGIGKPVILSHICMHETLTGL